MSKLLLAIKPEYVQKIFSGEKKFEYRTIIPSKEIDTVVIYETAPVSKVVGEFKVEGIIADTPQMIWYFTCPFGPGISKEDFYEYYKDKKQAVAFMIKKVKKYRKPKELKKYKLTSPPQGYVYIK